MSSSEAINLGHAMRGHDWWEDLRMPAQAIRVGAQAPTWNTTEIGWEFDDAPPFNQEVQLVAQMPHQWRENSAMIFHIHWTLLNAGAAGEDVKWDVLYRHAAIGGVWVAGFIVQQVTVDVSAVVAREHIVTAWATPVQYTMGISSIFDIRIERDTADAADDHPHPVILKSFDIHYRIDSPGSWQETLKWG
jgi:hypothetical protein